MPVRLMFQAEDPECCFHRPEKSPVKRVHFHPVLWFQQRRQTLLSPLFHNRTAQWPDLNQRRPEMKLKEIASGVRTGALLAMLAWSLLPQNAHAYLDPGTGSYILQVILAALFGALFMLKVFWTRITGFFRRRVSRSQEAGSQPGKASETSVSAAENAEPSGDPPRQQALLEKDDN